METKRVLLLGLSLFFCVSLMAQKGLIKKADKKFEQFGEYETAIELYKKAAKGNYKGLANMRIGEAIGMR